MSEANGSFRRNEKRPDWPRVKGEIGIVTALHDPTARFDTESTISERQTSYGPPFLRALYGHLFTQLRETLVTVHEIAVSGTVTITFHHHSVSYSGQTTALKEDARWRFIEKMNRAIDTAILLALLPSESPSEITLTATCTIESAE